MFPHEMRLLAGLWLDQWRSPEALERIRQKKLRRLITHAYNKVPFYRAIFKDRGLRPEDIRTLADLRELPLVSKKDLQGLPAEQKVAAGYRPRDGRTFMTSGTTGIPLTVFYSRRDWTMVNLGSARAFYAMGMRPWHRMASFVGKEASPKLKKWYEYLGLWRGLDLSSRESPASWLASLLRRRPDVLIGYVMTLRILGEAVRDGGPQTWRPALIISGSGVLDDFTRRLLISVFGCPVRDYYASFEAGTIAWECPACGGYHLSSDTVIIEILDDGGKPVPAGTPGEVVVTNLHSYAMPFIRYRQEDEAVLSTRRPRCRRGLPLLDRVQGRADDCVILPGGRKLPSQPFYYSIEPVRGVKRWKVVQEDSLSIRIDIEPGPEFGEDSRRLIERNLRKAIGDGMAFKFSIVPAIEIHPSQKFRQVSSRIAEAGACGPEDRIK